MASLDEDPRILTYTRDGPRYTVKLQPFWALFGTENTPEALHFFGASNRAELDHALKDLVVKCSCADCLQRSYRVPDELLPTSRDVVPNLDQLLAERPGLFRQLDALDAVAERTAEQEQERNRVLGLLAANDRMRQGLPPPAAA